MTELFTNGGFSMRAIGHGGGPTWRIENALPKRNKNRFSSINIPGLVFDLDADREDSLSLTADVVNSWTAITSTATTYSFDQTGSKRPTIDQDSKGRTALRFDAGSFQTLVSTDSIPTFSAGTAFIPFSLNTNPGIGAVFGLFGKSLGDDFDHMHFLVRESSGIGLSISADDFTAAPGNAVKGITGSFLTGIDNINIGIFRWNSSSWSISLGRSLLSLSVITGSNAGTPFSDITGDRWIIGAFAGSPEDSWLDGWIRGVKIFNRELTPVEEGSMLDDFDYRYSGLVVS